MMQPSVDTTALVGAAADVSEVAVKNSEFWSSIVIPFALLLFFSLAKYVIGVGIKEIRWVDLFAEIAIDVLSIFGAFIIGRYFLTTSTQQVLMSCTGKLAVLIVMAFIVSLLRKGIHSLMSKSEPSYAGIGGLLLLEYALDIFCIIMIFIFYFYNSVDY